MKTSRMKIVIQEATGLGERKGTENLTITNQGSGEDYARKVLDFLEGAREEKRRKEKKENERITWNMSAEVFSPAKEKEETEKSEGRDESKTVELYPQGELMTIHGDKSNDKEPENRKEKILLLTSKVIKDSLEETAIGQRIRDEEIIQRLRDEVDRSDQ